MLTKRQQPLNCTVAKRQKAVPFPNEPLTHVETYHSFDLSEHSRKNTLLGKHRDSLAERMAHVVQGEDLSQETWFLSTYILDFMLKKDQRRDKIHLLSTAAIFLASKYEEIYPLRLQDLTNGKYFAASSRESILDEECRILYAMEFRLFVNCYPSNVLEEQLLEIPCDPLFIETLRCLAGYLVNLSGLSYIMRRHTPSHIAHAALSVSLSIVPSMFPKQIHRRKTTKDCLANLCDVIKKHHTPESPMHHRYNRKLLELSRGDSLDDFIIC